jgi:class 3 adenylate cyclase/tetratricopeptide (TPR) repeat protein
VRCWDCNLENPTTVKFCRNCGTLLRNLCESCAFESPPQFAFCGRCGSALGRPQAETTPEVTGATVPTLPPITGPNTSANIWGPQGERKTITVMFVDIQGSTELMSDLDPEEARAILDPVLHLMIKTVHRYAGYVAQSTGDGIFALFGAPLAHEDHPQRALYAALRMQDEIRQYGDRMRSLQQTSLRARIGVNTGEVVLRTIETGGHAEYTAVGYVTNLAARMQGIAPADGIIITEDTQRLVEGYFTLRALGPTKVKGVSEAINVFEVTGLGPLRTHFQLSRRRGLTKFVGRESEIAELKQALEQVSAGHGRVFAVVAEAGVGKSRLFYELESDLPAKTKLLRAGAASLGRTAAWSPVLDLLWCYFDIQDSDDAATRRRKVREVVSALDPALTDSIPYLLGLLVIQEHPEPLAQMDAQIKRSRTLLCIKDILVRESLKQSTVIIVEDLQWLDEETQALLDLLVDSICNVRAMLLVNYRPEYRHRWANKYYYSQLRLNPLKREGARAMLSALLGNDVQLASLKRTIIERTEGNPFFIEEVTQVLSERNAPSLNPASDLSRSLGSMRLPATVQGILAGRIDRLSAEQKELLQMLSVMGRQSSLSLIREVVPLSGDNLDRLLADLQSGEFIYEWPSFGDSDFVFKHALTHEVAYNSVLTRDRARLHERVGAAIESLYPEQIDKHLRALAHHYSRSAASNKAVEYLRRAGEQAKNSLAYSEAVDYLAKALELLGQLPSDSRRSNQELLVQIALGACISAVRGFASPVLETIYNRSRELCIALGDELRLVHVLHGLWTFYHFRLMLGRAFKVAEDILNISQSLPKARLHQSAYLLKGITLFFQGELLSAREHLERSLSFFDPKITSHSAVEARAGSIGFLSLILWNLGFHDQAFSQIVDGLAMARNTGQPLALINMLACAAFLHACAGYGQVALDYAEEYALRAERYGLAHHSARAIHYRGMSLLALGQNERSVEEMRRGIATLSSTGAAVSASMRLFLAEGLKRTGKTAEALAIVTEALASCEISGEKLVECPLHTLKGQLLLILDSRDAKAAEGSFRKALEIARRQEAKLHELSATVGLARLFVQNGRINEGRETMTGIYSRLTEGFDSPAVREAKALLDELSR